MTSGDNTGFGDWVLSQDWLVPSLMDKDTREMLAALQGREENNEFKVHIEALEKDSTPCSTIKNGDFPPSPFSPSAFVFTHP